MRRQSRIRWIGVPVLVASLCAPASATFSCEIRYWFPENGTLVAHQGASFSQCFQIDGINTSTIQWSLRSGSLPPGLVLELDWGTVCPVIGGTGPYARVTGIPTALGVYPFVLEAAAYCDSHLFEMTIEVRSPSICGRLGVVGAPPAGVAGQSYRSILSASGGTPPYRFRLAGGTLPRGLLLSSWGTIQGIPEEVGTFAFVVEVVDAAGCIGTGSFTLDVACPFASLQPLSLPAATADVFFSEQLSVSAGAPPFLFGLESGSLPSGLTLTPSGLLYGTPSQSGLGSFRVRSVDALGCTARADYDLDVQGRVNLVVGMGAGLGNPNRIRLFDTSGAPVVDVLAYAAGHWGTEVASARLGPWALDSTISGPGPGPGLGPHVRAFDRSGVPLGGISFFAYGTLLWGVHPQAADLKGDGVLEIVTGAGAGVAFGPHVRGFDVTAGAPSPMPGVNFFAYSTLKYGVQLAGGDIVPGATDELTTGPGPGAAFGPSVRAWRYAPPIAPIPGLSFNAFAGAGHGVRVAAGSLSADLSEDVLAGRGPGPPEPAQVRGFEIDGSAPRWLPGFDLTPFLTRFGAAVGAGDMDRNGRVDLLVGAGPDPAADSTILWATYTGSAVGPMQDLGPGFTGASFGVNVASGHFDY